MGRGCLGKSLSARKEIFVGERVGYTLDTKVPSTPLGLTP